MTKIVQKVLFFWLFISLSFGQWARVVRETGGERRRVAAVLAGGDGTPKPGGLPPGRTSG